MDAIIVLGKWLNDDGTCSKALIERLELTIEAYNTFKDSIIITSGGIANKKANISESSIMKNYLINKGINENYIIEENKSNTTLENAKFSLDILNNYDIDRIIICTTYEHFNYYKGLNALDIFQKEVKKRNKNYRIIIYTNNEIRLD